MRPDFLKLYHHCHDCGVEEGEPHEIGCDMEVCPVCGGQAMTCYQHCYYPSGKVRETFADGRRVPYIIEPSFCVRCLAPFPKMFDVPDAEWDWVVPIRWQPQILCRACYDKIKGWRTAADKSNRGIAPKE